MSRGTWEPESSLLRARRVSGRSGTQYAGKTWEPGKLSFGGCQCFNLPQLFLAVGYWNLESGIVPASLQARRTVLPRVTPGLCLLLFPP
ncbi:hypothetical protein RB213_004916 [Colletotrichum asianum]